MPTEPERDILDPEYSAMDVRLLTDLACPIIRETLNHGTWVAKRCERAPDAQARVDEGLAPIVLYRQVLEMIDGVEVLLRQGCALASLPLLRSAYEAGLGLAYIAATKDPRVNLAWVTTYVHQRIRGYRNLLSEADLQLAWKEQFGNPLSIAGDPANAVANLESMLEQDHLRPINAEYRRLRAAKRPTPWYAFFDGPQDLSQLSRRVGRHADYLVLYGPWSRIAHGNDFASFVVSANGKGLSWRSVRDPDQLHHASILAISFMFGASRSLLHYARPGESVRAWYLREIQGPFRQLRSMTVNVRHVSSGAVNAVP